MPTNEGTVEDRPLTERPRLPSLMTITLPLGVENYLRESGFSSSEVIVLRKLLEENLLTIRELSAKTGKGNGVIDAALKKLLRHNIVGKETMNEHTRYKVIDPQAIVAWTKRNLREHTDMMERRHQSFAQFMKHLTVAKHHPEIEHFSGADGFMKAHDKLLETRTELLTYTDPASIPGDDPLAAFRLQYFRRRQVHGVFQRIIAPDSPRARRFRSRDPFEYRRTLPIRPEDYPLSFEKVIAGDIVACLDNTTMEASFIRFPQLAASERTAFERLWTEQVERDRAEEGLHPIVEVEPSTMSLKQSFSMNIFQKISVGFLAMLCVFWITLFVTNTTSGFYNYLYSFLFGLIPLFSGAVAMCSTKRWGGFKTALGKAVFFVGLGIFLVGCGEMMWSYYNFILSIPIPYPSLADLCFAPSTFFYSLGVIYLSDATGATLGLKNIYAKTFVVIAPLVVLSFTYYFLITLARGGVLVSPGGSTLKTILDIVNPLGDFLGLSIAVLISGLSFQYMRGRYIFDIWAILSGLAVMFVADFIFSYTTTVGTFYNGDFGDLVYTIGLFLLSFGILGFCKDKEVSIQAPSPTMSIATA